MTTTPPLVDLARSGAQHPLPAARVGTRRTRWAAGSGGWATRRRRSCSTSSTAARPDPPCRDELAGAGAADELTRLLDDHDVESRAGQVQPATGPLCPPSGRGRYRCGRVAQVAFELTDAVLPVPDEVRAELRREWTRLAEPGTWLSGPERVAVAREARAARTYTDADTGLPDLLIEAAQSVSAAAALITREWVSGLRAQGMEIEQYVEVVGIVSRLSAVDAYVRGLGSAEEPLPAPVAGAPTRERNEQVRWRNAFVPTEPEDGARFALTAVPAEEEARDRLHARLYLSTEQMADLAHQGVLSRAQMELLAARVSLLNDCFY